MVDWADEKAKSMFPHGENPFVENTIAAALRKARTDALEEAAVALAAEDDRHGEIITRQLMVQRNG